ncbi:MAG TPA: SgcJ/EcaC family oxidoreductase [Kutzneria sp.]|jgi:uncharacterized protein (TIGR02246 family)|nr:SgcJ/EcaC family oxidoreductase [Kutzneria sp.]
MSESPTALLDFAEPRQVPERTTAAWLAGDAEAFAAEFTDDALVVIAGHYLRGHAQVLGYVTKAFAGPMKGTGVISNPIHLSYLDQDTVLLITDGGVLAPGETAPAPERSLYGTWILSRRDGRWGISAYHSSRPAS